MVQVLETAAQRVAQEAQAVVVGASHSVMSPDSELQALAKQQHVLTDIFNRQWSDNDNQFDLTMTTRNCSSLRSGSASVGDVGRVSGLS